MKRSIFLLYLLFSCVIATMIAGTVYYLHTMAELDRYSRAYLHNDAQKLRLLQPDELTPALDRLRTEGLPFTVFAWDDGASPLIGLLFSGEQEAMEVVASHIVAGRFFRAEDFLTGDRCAVVGAELADQVYPASDGEWIDLGGVPYRVIGRLDTGTGTLMDRCVYYALDAHDAPAAVYVDGDDARQIRATLDALAPHVSFQTLDVPVNGIARLLGLSGTGRAVLLLVGCAVLVFHLYAVRLFASGCESWAAAHCLFGRSLRSMALRMAAGVLGILSAVGLTVCLVGGVLAARWAPFGPIAFPVETVLAALALVLVLPATIHGAFYFRKRLERRLVPS